jgi:hypothetical protein
MDLEEYVTRLKYLRIEVNEDFLWWHHSYWYPKYIILREKQLTALVSSATYFVSLSLVSDLQYIFPLPYICKFSHFHTWGTNEINYVDLSIQTNNWLKTRMIPMYSAWGKFAGAYRGSFGFAAENSFEDCVTGLIINSPVNVTVQAELRPRSIGPRALFWGTNAYLVRL